jgi:hypothetical protein
MCAAAAVQVSYPELMAQLEASPLIKQGTLIVVEYPKRETSNMLEEIGRLQKARRRAAHASFM